VETVERLRRPPELKTELKTERNRELKKRAERSPQGNIEKP
jgi:hypothetical protein